MLSLLKPCALGSSCLVIDNVRSTPNKDFNCTYFLLALEGDVEACIPYYEIYLSDIMLTTRLTSPSIPEPPWLWSDSGRAALTNNMLP